MELKTTYFSEGEILTRNLYKSSPFYFNNIIIKDSSIIGKQMYLKFNDKYLTITNKEETQIFAEYIQPNNYFTSEFFSGQINIIQNPSDFEASLKDNRYFFIIPSIESLRKEISKDLEINILDYAANTINISYQHTNPKFVQDICNAIANVYLSR